MTTAILEGTIDPCDFEKLQTFLADNKDVVQIYLASPGGNLGEALRMGLLVRRLNLSTIVPSKVLTHQALEQLSRRHGLKRPEQDYVCASACFFILSLVFTGAPTLTASRYSGFIVHLSQARGCAGSVQIKHRN
jgi:hypothetical protein